MMSITRYLTSIAQTADEMVPEIMQATKNITYIDCGRRFQVSRVNSVSARAQNWIDADGTASGTGVPTFMVPAIPEARNWWAADNDGKTQIMILSVERGDPVSAHLTYAQF